MQNKRLPSGTLKPLCNIANISIQYLSDIAATRKRPGRKTALKLEAAARELGKNIPASMWLFGSKTDLRTAITNAS